VEYKKKEALIISFLNYSTFNNNNEIGVSHLPVILIFFNSEKKICEDGCVFFYLNNLINKLNLD